jgi:hypothetical protein
MIDQIYLPVSRVYYNLFWGCVVIAIEGQNTYKYDTPIMIDEWIWCGCE